jgi:hypothetical protein
VKTGSGDVVHRTRPRRRNHSGNPSQQPLDVAAVGACSTPKFGCVPLADLPLTPHHLLRLMVHRVRAGAIAKATPRAPTPAGPAPVRQLPTAGTKACSARQYGRLAEPLQVGEAVPRTAPILFRSGAFRSNCRASPRIRQTVVDAAENAVLCTFNGLYRRNCFST